MNRLYRTCLLTLSALFLAQGLAVAQQVSDLTLELIDQRINTLRDAGAADDSEPLSIYESTRTLLTQEETFLRDAATFGESLTAEPEREAAIQQRLDALDAEYDPLLEIQGMSTEQMGARLSQARIDERDLQSQIDALDRRLAQRENNANTIRERFAQIEARLNEIQSGVPIIDPAAAPSEIEATQWRTLAELRALNAENLAREAQLESQPVRFSAMAAERAELDLNLGRLSALIQALETSGSGSAQETTSLADLDIAESDPAYALATRLVEMDQQLSQEQQVLSERLAAIRQQNQDIQQRSESLEERYSTARRIVDFGGDSESLGRVLITYWQEVESFRVANPVEELSREIGSAVISRIDYEDMLASLVSATAYVNAQLRNGGVDPETVSGDTREAVLQLARSYRERLRAVITELSLFIDASSELDVGYSQLEGRVDEYRDFLQGLLLWIPNYPSLWLTTQSALVAEAESIMAALGDIPLAASPWFFIAFLASLYLFLSRKRLRQAQLARNAKIQRPRDDSILHTVTSLGILVLRSLPLSLLIFSLATLIDASLSSQSQSVQNNLLVTSAVFFVLSILRIISEDEGIGREHFDWKDATMDGMFSGIGFSMFYWMPLAVAASIIVALTPDTGDVAIGRFVLLVALLVLLVHFTRVQLRDVKGQASQLIPSWFIQLRWASLLALVAMMATIVFGQVFWIFAMTTGLINTVFFGALITIVHALLLRWLRVAKRRLRFQQLLAQRAQLTAEEAGTAVDENLSQLGEISTDTQQLVNVSAIAAAFAAIVFIWGPLLPALDVFERVQLWSTTSEINGELIVNQITLATLITVAILAGLTLFAAKRIPAVVEIILRSRTHVSAGSRYTTSTLLNYLIIAGGIILGLGALGVQWSQLQWLVAALGVGIGFGLQEIVANFISGLIILFEHPIRVGDVVTVGDKDGTVTKIRIRATTIRDWDGKELLVPNKEFITGRLLNWTLSDSQNRLVIPVGIAYGSDVEEAIRLLYKVVDEHPNTLAEPKSLIVFEHFGDNALELTARSFLDSLEDRWVVATDLRTRIYKAFSEAGIVIAFPQRDVHLDVTGPINVALQSDRKEHQ
jgi:potassium efflux system protein